MSPFHKHMPCCVDPTVEAVCQSYLQKHIVGAQPIMNVKIILSFLLGDSKGLARKKNRHNNLSGMFLNNCPSNWEMYFQKSVCAGRSENIMKNTEMEKIIISDVLHICKWKQFLWISIFIGFVKTFTY